MEDDAVSVTLVTAHDNTAGAAILTFGVVIFCVTVADAVFVQPFDGSVTVTVYEPGVDTVFVVVIFPPPQSNVAPAVVDDAVNVTLVTAHVNTAGEAILAFGVVMFCVTVADAVLVQPFDGSVTVTVNVPGADTALVDVVLPPPQSNVTPAVEDDAVSVTLVTEQSSTAGAAILALGVAMFWDTVVDAVFVQPLAGSVTETV